MAEGVANANAGQAGQPAGAAAAGGAGNAGAPPPAAAAVPSPSSSLTTPGDWTAGFSDDQKAFIANKHFTKTQDLLDSYVALEKFRGIPQERILALPEGGNFDSPEGRALLEKLGMPKDAKGYALEVPKETGDPKFSEWAQEAFHKRGLTKAQAEGINADWNAMRAEQVKAYQENLEASAKNADAALRKEWGMAYEQNRVVADAGAKNAGITAEEYRSLGMALGNEKAMKLLHKIGASTGESSFISGRPAPDGTLAPNQARLKRDALLNDSKFRDRLLNNDASAKSEWNRVHEMISGNEMVPL